MTAQAPMIGTAEWLAPRAAQRTASQRDAAQRLAALAIARGEAPHFDGIPAADPRGSEPVAPRMRASVQYPTTALRMATRGMLRRIAQDAASGVEHVERRDIMRAARQARRDALNARREPVVIVEHDALVSGDDIAALEARYSQLRAERMMVEHVASSAPNGTRPASVTPLLVNGQEVRGSERWNRTARRDVRNGDGSPVDWACYRLIPPASGIGPAWRERFSPPGSEVEGKRKRGRPKGTTKAVLAARQARLRDIARGDTPPEPDAVG